ncbi:MAG TPA: bifunctional 5,10-methylenetetrahydrofolate dehydrogenase/5,10-methenyltetrahydrofolate cyclohydrolase, partial [bacterium (Candidatus Stahlbacteria)]|nr:bifunctional 5,10-methylenetetrahydrofolate dehydrogenase/5,10-methenyltetrahydrofolate cyclohydrolase [Candidatus Stahlbacteria bacterium]
IDGKKIASTVEEELKKSIPKDSPPSLAFIFVENDSSALSYIKSVERISDRVGIGLKRVAIPENSSTAQITDIVVKLNKDKGIHGILVSKPLPKGVDESIVIETISPLKDIDCVHPLNLGRLLLGEPFFIPSTPYAVVKILAHENIEVSGKNVVIIGRSNVVGRPLACMLGQRGRDATVTVCHTKTRNLREHTINADILVVACGCPKLIKEDMVRANSVVIDVGINVVDGKLVGDVDFNTVKEKVAAITPVPGGVGPVTTVMLLKNTIKAWQKLTIS